MLHHKPLGRNICGTRKSLHPNFKSSPKQSLSSSNFPALPFSTGRTTSAKLRCSTSRTEGTWIKTISLNHLFIHDFKPFLLLERERDKCKKWTYWRPLWPSRSLHLQNQVSFLAHRAQWSSSTSEAALFFNLLCYSLIFWEPWVIQDVTHTATYQHLWTSELLCVLPLSETSAWSPATTDGAKQTYGRSSGEAGFSRRTDHWATSWVWKWRSRRGIWGPEIEKETALRTGLLHSKNCFQPNLQSNCVRNC